MIDVLEMLMQEEPDTWCDKFYHKGSYHTLDTPLWGVRSSVHEGIVAHEVVPLKGNHPFDGLWRHHYATIVRKMENIALSKFDIDSQDDMRRRIAVLCQRNRYPANSLAHIFVWREGRVSSGKTDYAIFQQKLKRNAFAESGLKRIITQGTTGETINIAAGPWADIAVEASARRKVAERTKADLTDYAGIELLRPDGRIARTTLGNIYITNSRRVIGVREGEGAAPCALLPFLKTAIEEINGESNPLLAITYEETDGIDDTMIKNASGCFVLDTAIGLAPIMRLRTTFRNDLTNILAEKFRQLF